MTFKTISRHFLEFMGKGAAVILGDPPLSFHDLRPLPCWCACVQETEPHVCCCLENDSALHFIWWREMWCQSFLFRDQLNKTASNSVLFVNQNEKKQFFLFLPGNTNVLTVWPHDFWVAGRQGILRHVHQITWTLSSSRTQRACLPLLGWTQDDGVQAAFAELRLFWAHSTVAHDPHTYISQQTCC